MTSTQDADTGTQDPAATNPAIGKDVQAGGIRTNYLEAGTGDTHVVLVHGSGPGVTSYANWRGVLPALGEHFHVVAPDMVGFGYSERPEEVDYGLDTWADQTLGVLDALGIEKAHLVGNSFGGAIALRLATQHPDRVDRLVLMGSMGVPFEITEGLDNVWGFEGTLEHMKTVMGYFAYDKSLTSGDLAQARFEGATQPGFQESFSAMFPAPRQRWVEAMTVPDDDLRALPHRTLVVHGREDRVIPLANSYRLLELLDNADLSVFSHCGHWSMIERRDDFNRQVRDFFLND
jgi:pimeloyl-ACP methyl ester carboxylesterase